jgi:hypothetical protein
MTSLRSAFFVSCHFILFPTMTTAAGAACALSDALSSTSDMWDHAVEELECQGGMAVVKVPPNVAKVHAHAFQVARCCLENACHDDVTIPPDADSAHVTGYHPPQGMNHYNAFREGFVFSDGNLIVDDVMAMAIPMRLLWRGLR